MNTQKPGLIRLESESIAFPWIKELMAFTDRCLPVAKPGNSRAENFYNSSQAGQLSCSHQVDAIEPLETPESGFLGKAEILLGQKLDPEFIHRQDSYAELDFSMAPQLKAIFVATLVYRSDFYGTVMARLLKFHADRGTPVFVNTTAYMMFEKDKKLLRGLARDNKNFRLQEFIYHDSSPHIPNPLRYVDTKFRDMHIKMFVTLSDEPKYNSVIIGGRNIHDGFLFLTRPDHSRFPELIQYGVEDDFVHWNDFEIKLTSVNEAHLMAAHFLRFWNRDETTQTMTDLFAAGDSSESATQDKIGLRHLISVPYLDDHRLEQIYVDLIDSAEQSIKISSPYLRPTAKIMAAIERAISRNVDIIIQTRVSLAGDTEAWLYEEVNKESINLLFDKVKIYEWKEDSILHSKFTLIDGKVGFIGSVNLSRRSFIQDVENGFLVKSEPFIQTMEQIFAGYIAKSRQITEPEKRKFWPSLLIRIFKDQF